MNAKGIDVGKDLIHILSLSQPVFLLCHVVGIPASVRGGCEGLRTGACQYIPA